MKSSEIPVGTHVVYDRNEMAGSYHSFTEAYVFDIRPKGTKPADYWGGKNRNHDTIGIAYRGYGREGEPARWEFTWTRPQNIHFLWDDYQESLNLAAVRESDARKAEEKRQKEDEATWAAFPESVRKALSLSSWAEEQLLTHGYRSFQLTVPMIQAICDAAIAHANRNSPEAIQAEVEAALKLL